MRAECRPLKGALFAFAKQDTRDIVDVECYDAAYAKTGAEGSSRDATRAGSVFEIFLPTKHQNAKFKMFLDIYYGILYVHCK